MYYIEEDQYEEAREAYSKNQFESVAQCARYFGLNCRRLARRISGLNSKSTRRPTNQRLNEAQEITILDYIQSLDDACMSPSPSLITGAVSYIIQKADGLATPVGQHWWTRFHKRHPELFKRRQRPLAAARKDAYDIEELEHFYRKLKEAVDRYGIQQADMWNMDETGFRIGVGRTRLVISFDKKKRNYIADPDNRDYCTTVESISAAGATIPPLIILKAVNVLLKWSQQNDLEDQCVLGASESGYSNDDLALEWLQHFIDHTRKGRIGRYILLIVDGFGSHMTLQFFQLATASDIILFKLPAHSTHITQPLDVGVFQPYKTAHGNEIEKAVRNGDAKFNRLSFLAALREMRASVFINGTIRNAWRRCGLWPYDPDVVLNPMKDKMIERANVRPITPPPVDDCLQRTPHGPDSLKKNIRALQDHRVQFGNYNINEDQMERFLKGSEASLYTLELTIRDLDSARRDTAKKAKRASLPGYRAKTSGIITVGQCREQFSERAKKEAAATERKAIREAAKAEKQAAKDAEEALANAQAEEAEAKKKSGEKKDEKESEEEDEEEDEEEEEEEVKEEADPPFQPPPFRTPRPPNPSVETPYLVFHGTENQEENERIYEDLITGSAIIGEKRVRKPSRRMLERDSPPPSPPPPRRRRRLNYSPE